MNDIAASPPPRRDKAKNKGQAPKVKGNLTEVRPGVWKYRRYMGTVDGRERIQSKTFHAADAEEAAMLAVEHARAMMADKQERVAKAELVAGLVDGWWAQQQHTASPTTLLREKSIVDRIQQRLGPIRLAELNARHVEQFYTWLRTTKFRRTGQKTPLPLSESTVHHHHRVLSAILHTGERWGRLDVVATRRAQPPKRTRSHVRPPTPIEVARVIDYAAQKPGQVWHLVFMFLAKTGCRRGEVCAIRWSDLRNGVLWVERAIIKDGPELVEKPTKTDGLRLVELDEPTQVMLAAWRRELEQRAGGKLSAKARIFPDLAADPRGVAPIKPDSLSQAWQRSCEATGVSARLHDLRHWHATQLLKGGMAVQDVSNRLGHAQTSTTLNIYAHASDPGSTTALMTAAIALPDPPVSS